MSLEELQHHARVIDMMLTAHCKLRDRNKLYASIADLFLLGASIALCAMVFFDSRILAGFQINPDISRIVVGVCSTLVFFISLVALRVDWKGRAQKHAEAAGLLGWCKAECQKIRKCRGEPSADAVADVCRQCVWVFRMVPEIPESKFLKLKALHKRKIEISKMVDNNPGCPVIFLKLRLYGGGLSKLFADSFRKKKVTDGDETTPR